jgi:hypothetical protein
MENRKIIESVKRSRALTRRSFWTSFGAVCILLFIPAILAGAISFVINVSAQAFNPGLKTAIDNAKKLDREDTRRRRAAAAAATGEPVPVDDQPRPESAETAENGPKKDEEQGFGWVIGRRNITLGGGGRHLDMRSKLTITALESINQILWLPAQILVFSFSAIIIALLYLKTRLAGGEGLQELIERFEDDGRPRKKWQERVRQRLIQSGRIPSKP